MIFDILTSIMCFSIAIYIFSVLKTKDKTEE